MYLWGSSDIPSNDHTGVHYFNVSQYGDAQPNFVIASTTNYAYPGTNQLNLYDYRLDASGGIEASRLVASYSATTPFRYASAISPNGNIEVVYQIQNADGTSSLIQSGYDATLSTTLGQSTIASGITGVFDQSIQSANRTGTSASYAYGWDAYNATTATQDIYLRVFNPDGTPSSAVIDAIHLTGISASNPESLFRMRSAAGSYVLEHTATASDGHQYVQLDKYNLDGTLNSFHFTVDDGAASITAVDFQQVSSSISSSTQYVVAFAERTTSGAYQVTVEGLNGSGTLLSTSHFATSATDRVDLRSNGTNGYLLSYGDTSATHLVQLDLTGHQIGSIVDVTQPQVAAEAQGRYGGLVSFTDGRFGILDNTLNSDGVTSQSHIQIYDTRTSGLSVDHSSGTTAEQIAGTAFNDVIKGGSANDIIAAAGGSDILSGGAGDDTVVLPFRQTDTILSRDSSGNVVLDGPNSAHEVLSDFEHYRFTDGSLSNINQVPFGIVTMDPHSSGGEVYALYEGLLARAPDTIGLEYWADQFDHGASPATLASGFLASSEGQMRLGAADSNGFVQQLYQNTLHRAADQSGLDYWTGQLAHGESRTDVADSFVFSPEFTSSVQQMLSSGLFVPDAQASEVARIYYTMLGRAPDASGLHYWTDQIDHGGSPSSVAQAFLSTPESQNTYGQLNNHDYVDALYVNALGRHADQGGSNYWTGQLDHGTSRADLAVQLSQSPESQSFHLSQIEQGWHLT